MKKSSQEKLRKWKYPKHENEIRWVFTPAYDFSSFLSSEIDEIRRHQTLESFAREALVEEREHIFERARLIDKRLNMDVVATTTTTPREFRRYACLEDALRHLLYGNCKLGYRRRNTYVLAENRIWVLKWIPNIERIYVGEDIKYNKDYLEYIVKNRIATDITIGWYDGNKDSNIETENNIKGEEGYKDNKGGEETSTEENSNKEKDDKGRSSQEENAEG